MTLTPKEKNEIVQILREYFPAAEFQLLLFGSYAKQTARTTSDIDIAIRGKQPLSGAQWQKAISRFEDSLFPKKIDLVDFQRVSPEFQAIIERDGIHLD